MVKLLKYTLWSAVFFCAFSLVYVAAQYFTFDSEHHFLNMKKDMLSNPIWLAAFYVHLAFGIVSVLSGLPLFFHKLIPFSSGLHKKVGKIYVLAILFLTGPTGFYLSFQAEGGWVATIGFLLMSMIWMFFTYKAFWWIAVQKNVEKHFKWMIRSYCFTLSGVTLRVFTPIAMHYIDMDAALTLKVAAFLPWIINIVIGELIIFVNKNSIHALALKYQKDEKR